MRQLQPSSVMMDGTATLGKLLQDRSIQQLWSQRYVQSVIRVLRDSRQLAPQTNTKTKSVKLLAILARLATNAQLQLYLNAVRSIIASLVRQCPKCATWASTPSKLPRLLFQIAHSVQLDTFATALDTRVPHALRQMCPLAATRSAL